MFQASHSMKSDSHKLVLQILKADVFLDYRSAGWSSLLIQDKNS